MRLPFIPWSIAGVPSSQALPGFLITAPPFVCVPAVPCRFKNEKKKGSVQGHSYAANLSTSWGLQAREARALGVAWACHAFWFLVFGLSCRHTANNPSTADAFFFWFGIHTATVPSTARMVFFWVGIHTTSVPSTAETHTGGGAVLRKPEGNPATLFRGRYSHTQIYKQTRNRTQHTSVVAIKFGIFILYCWCTKKNLKHVKVGLGIWEFCAISRRLISKIRFPHPISVADAICWTRFDLRDSKRRALENWSCVRICYMFRISKCRGDWDLGLCTTSVLALGELNCHGKIRFFLRRNTFFFSDFAIVNSFSKGKYRSCAQNYISVSSTFWY